MGKKRRNHNKKKNKTLDNPCDKEKLSPLYVHDAKKEKNISYNNSNSLPVQEKVSSLKFPKCNVVSSEKNSAIIKSKSNLLTCNGNDDSMQEYNHKKAVELNNHQPVLTQNSHIPKFSSFHKTPNPSKPEALSNTSVKKSVKNSSQNNFGVRPKYEVLNPVPEPYMYHQDSSNIFLTENSSESEDDYIGSTSEFFEPVFHDRHESGRNLKHKNDWEGLKMKENLFSSINLYKNSKASFSNIYRRWLPVRRNTIAKLRSLYREVHDDAMKYNETQATFKELSYNSRIVKRGAENQAVDFLASLTAFFSDAASGMSSFAQACNVDSYQSKFQDIMDCDAEITKDLYTSRSQCVVKYQGIEEVMRSFHSDTFTSTVSKISNTLEVNKHWEAMKNAYRKDDMPKLLDVIFKFFDNACQPEILGKVGDSVQTYVNDNPAALEACKSTGKALYGAINTFGEKKNYNRNSIMGNVNSVANLCMLADDKTEIDRLKSVIGEDTYQSKLESQIEDAIDSLESEMKEMNDIYFQLFKSHIYDDDSEDDSDYRYFQ